MTRGDLPLDERLDRIESTQSATNLILMEFRLEMTREITTLKTSARVWGGMMGLVAGGVVGALATALIS